MMPARRIGSRTLRRGFAALLTGTLIAGLLQAQAVASTPDPASLVTPAQRSASAVGLAHEVPTSATQAERTTTGTNRAHRPT